MLADWEGIALPRGSALNVLRADPSHPLDFRIGRDARGRFAFQLESAGDAQGTGGIESPAGMEVSLDDAGDGVLRLTLLLHDREDFPIFRVLCGDLLEVTRQLATAEAPRAVRMLLGRLEQWQEVMARRRQGRLSHTDVIGLVGELLFLRDVLSPRVGLPQAVGSWRGPYADEQDFAFGDAIVEVKTRGSSADSRIFVSSEDQLDTSTCAIFLCRQCLAPTASSEDGDSLDEIALALLAATGPMSAAGIRLQSGLEAAGWVEGVGYDERWHLTSRSYYSVGEGFPRIVRTDLRPGVSRVQYQIAVADCLPFSVDEAALFTGVAQ
jgi:hypothetical protein